jgi:hypothetical protein
MDFQRHYTIVRAHVERTYGPDYRKLAWATFIYACHGDMRRQTGQRNFDPSKITGCGYEHRIWLGVGVEGPPDAKAQGLVIPSPMFAGSCPKCGGMMGHVRWNEDETWDEPREIPEDVHRLLVPSSRKSKKLAKSNYGGGQLVAPEAHP